MRKATINRRASSSDGTFGKYISDSGLVLVTIERPWKDNKEDVSSIPLGTYECLWQFSKKHSCNLYHLQNVLGRTNVEIHSANVYQQLLGCIAPGHAELLFKANSIRPGCPDRDMWGVTQSVAALSDLEKDMFEDGKQVPFQLEIANE